jgi:hypothetical protein
MAVLRRPESARLAHSRASGDGPLSELIADAQPWPAELVFMPLFGHLSRKGACGARFAATFLSGVNGGLGRDRCFVIRLMLDHGGLAGECPASEPLGTGVPAGS